MIKKFIYFINMINEIVIEFIAQVLKTRAFIFRLLNYIV